MNDKAVESMNKDEPETALEFLKKADETMNKLENKNKPTKSIDKVPSTLKRQDP